MSDKKSKNEPETLCIAWLSSCQQFTLLKDLYFLGVKSAFSSLGKKEAEMLSKVAKAVVKKENKNKIKRLWNKMCKLKNKKDTIDIIVEKILDSTKLITASPIVGAVAVRYKHDNSFSVFIGIAMNKDEEKDIAYIKSMGQRTTEQIARGIFPQFDGMAYHN